MAAALLVVRPWAWCPPLPGDAPRIALDRFGGAHVTLDGRTYDVGGSALLDYGLRVIEGPIDRAIYELRGERHPLTVVASISASSREALGEPTYTCFRATHGTEVWAVRPTTYGTQTLADALPPGAPPPTQNEAWRQAVARDGPEWPPGDPITLELWLSVNGRDYVLTVPPLPLLKGL